MTLITKKNLSINLIISLLSGYAYSEYLSAHTLSYMDCTAFDPSKCVKYRGIDLYTLLIYSTLLALFSGIFLTALDRFNKFTTINWIIQVIIILFALISIVTYTKPKYKEIFNFMTPEQTNKPSITTSSSPSAHSNISKLKYEQSFHQFKVSIEESEVESKLILSNSQNQDTKDLRTITLPTMQTWKKPFIDLPEYLLIAIDGGTDLLIIDRNGVIIAISVRNKNTQLDEWMFNFQVTLDQNNALLYLYKMDNSCASAKLQLDSGLVEQGSIVSKSCLKQ